MEEKKVLYKVKNGIAYVTLNSPNNLNPLTAEIKNELVHLLSDYKINNAVKAIIITGSGKAFSAGGDLANMAKKSDITTKRNNFLNSLNLLPKLIMEIEKPVIAAINGFAIGAGCTFALACDLIIASDSAKFGISFNKMGLALDAGGTYLLPKAVGLVKAKELAFTGKIINAEEAERIGMINKVVPSDQLMIEAEKIASQIICWPKIAIGITKKLLNQGMDGDLANALEREAFAQSHLMMLPDHKEAVNAFLEKREPIFED